MILLLRPSRDLGATGDRRILIIDNTYRATDAVITGTTVTIESCSKRVVSNSNSKNPMAKHEKWKDKRK